MEDETTELSVLVDRAVGGSSLVDGQIELMLHRFFLEVIKHFCSLSLLPFDLNLIPIDLFSMLMIHFQKKEDAKIISDAFPFYCIGGSFMMMLKVLARH